MTGHMIQDRFFLKDVVETLVHDNITILGKYKVDPPHSHGKYSNCFSVNTICKVYAIFLYQ